MGNLKTFQSLFVQLLLDIKKLQQNQVTVLCTYYYERDQDAAHIASARNMFWMGKPPMILQR